MCPPLTTALPRRTLALALAGCPGIGDRTVCQLLEKPAAWAALPSGSETALARPEGTLTARQARNWTDRRALFLKDAQSRLEGYHELGITVLIWDEPGYPETLKARHTQPPALLFAYGNLTLLTRPTTALLASRSAPLAALHWLEAQAEKEVLEGRVLVCGHDTPEYQASAIVPLRWGAPRILVLDTSLDQALGPDLTQEPFRSARLWRYQFDPQTDLALSFVLPGRPYYPTANQRRDQLLVALADRLGFGWLSSGGNMERLAQKALKQACQEVIVGGHLSETRRWIEQGAYCR